ncbi:TonB-dependent receptor [Aquirufa sp. 2-AUSEE-184A6]|uniref:TonB-dependent receptor n=1 Tax=Aquirufa novilacunae TaxID=3139305 RepID=A0ABW8SY82_9BACT
MSIKSRLIALFILTSTSIFAQNSRLAGSVFDARRQPVNGVNVRLLELKKGKLSDETGQFSIPSLPSGTYTLQASYVGYKTLQQSITLEEGKTLNLALELLETTTDLKEIVVVGHVSQNEKPVSIGKLPIRPMDLPQSVMTLDRTLLETQQVRSMSDVLMNTNGVYIMGTTGGYQEEISARGFSMGSSNTFKNGMRYANGMMSELSGIEKVEILKGSAAILYGNVAAGGVLNLVTKKPKFNFGGEISLRSGSWGLIKPSIDFYGGLSSKVAVRLNATHEKANSFREGVRSERFYVNPSLLFKLSDKTELVVEGDYLEDRRTPDFGAGIINYKIVDVPRERFLGVAWSYMNQNQSSITTSLTHRLTDQWTIKLMAGIRNNGFDLFSNARPNAGSFVSEDGRWIRNLQKANARENYGIAQVDVTGTLHTGVIKHQLLVGADSDYFNTVTNAFNQFARYDTINILGPNPAKKRVDQPAMTPFTTTTAPINRVGLYVQDLVHVSEKMKLLVGLRYSYQQTTSELYTYSTSKTTVSTNFDGAFSPRLGLVFQPTKSHAIFASYANSFALNSGVDINNNALPPSLIDQYELGIKNELLKGMLSANVTAYRILNNNLAQNSLINATTYSYVKELVGAVQSEGLEIDLSTKPVAGISFTGGYSYNETKYVKSNTYIEGSLLRYNPNHTANIGISFRHNGWQAGLTSVYIGERFAGRSTRVAVANDAYRLIELPAYTQVDFSLSYRIKHFIVRSKVANLGDVLSYNVHDDNSVNPITPRNYSLSLTFAF